MLRRSTRTPGTLGEQLVRGVDGERRRVHRQHRARAVARREERVATHAAAGVEHVAAREVLGAKRRDPAEELRLVVREDLAVAIPLEAEAARGVEGPAGPGERACLRHHTDSSAVARRTCGERRRRIRALLRLRREVREHGVHGLVDALLHASRDPAPRSRCAAGPVRCRATRPSSRACRGRPRSGCPRRTRGPRSPGSAIR